jgi:hypothetical protein
MYRLVRTTLTLDDDVFTAAQTLARSSGKTLGQVLSDLARRGLRATPEFRSGTDLPPAFEVPPAAPGICLEAIRRTWSEE